MIAAEQSRFLSTLRDLGFAVIPDLISRVALRRLSAAYDQAIATGKEPDLRRSSSGSNVRLCGLIGESTEFNELFALQPILEACEDTIAGPFVLSSMGARTVLPGATKQILHVDVQPDDAACPLIGFIIMVDAFRSENGATRFVPGSHRRESSRGASKPITAPMTRSRFRHVVLLVHSSSTTGLHGTISVPMFRVSRVAPSKARTFHVEVNPDSTGRPDCGRRPLINYHCKRDHFSALIDGPQLAGPAPGSVDARG